MYQYETHVREFYNKKKAEGKLSMHLIYPTPAKLRDECLRVFREGCSDADVQMLKSFLCKPSDEVFHERAIKRFEIAKFKL